MDDPTIEYPENVNVVELETAAFKCAKDADAWARSHGIVGLMSSIEVLAGNCRVVTRPNTIASMSVSMLLKDVLNVNGEFLLTPPASPTSSSSTPTR